MYFINPVICVNNVIENVLIKETTFKYFAPSAQIFIEYLLFQLLF